jgi:hypothetical protein
MRQKPFLVTPRNQPQAAPFGVHLAKGDPQLEVLIQESIVSIILMPRELTCTLALEDRLIPAHPEVRTDYISQEIHQPRLGNKALNPFTAEKQVVVKEHFALIQVAWLGAFGIGGSNIMDERVHFLRREKARGFGKALLPEVLAMVSGSK